MSDGNIGHGCKLMYAAATNETSYSNFTAIANVSNISVDGMAMDHVDMSTMDSANKWREYVAGMKEGGEITADINYDGSASGTCDKLFNTLYGEEKGYAIFFNETTNPTSNSLFTCPGTLTRIGMAIPFDAKMNQPVTIKILGEPSFADAA